MSDQRCTCEARMAGECMCGAWDDAYSTRELRLMSERDAALTRAEIAETDVALWRKRYDEIVAAAKASTATLRVALREACELADEGWEYAGDYFRGKWDSAGRIAKLRKLAKKAMKIGDYETHPVADVFPPMDDEPLHSTPNRKEHQ